MLRWKTFVPRAFAASASGTRRRIGDAGMRLARAFELQRAECFSAVVDELAIDLVRDEIETAVATKRRDHFQLFARVDGARRIVRIADDDRARARRDRAFEDVARREMKPVASACGDRHDVESGHRREREVVRVERLDDEDVVAFIRARHECEEDRFAAAGRRENLIDVDIESETFLVVALE